VAKTIKVNKLKKQFHLCNVAEGMFVMIFIPLNQLYLGLKLNMSKIKRGISIVKVLVFFALLIIFFYVECFVV
jgi:hypothetical protein